MILTDEKVPFWMPSVPLGMRPELCGPEMYELVNEAFPGGEVTKDNFRKCDLAAVEFVFSRWEDAEYSSRVDELISYGLSSKDLCELKPSVLALAAKGDSATFQKLVRLAENSASGIFKECFATASLANLRILAGANCRPLQLTCSASREMGKRKMITVFKIYDKQGYDFSQQPFIESFLEDFVPNKHAKLLDFLKKWDTSAHLALAIEAARNKKCTDETLDLCVEGLQASDISSLLTICCGQEDKLDVLLSYDGVDSSPELQQAVSLCTTKPLVSSLEVLVSRSGLKAASLEKRVLANAKRNGSRKLCKLLAI